MKLFKRKEKFYPEPPPAPYPSKLLKDKCPVCKVKLRGGSAFCGLDGEHGTMAYTCLNCMTTEGRQKIQDSYKSYAFWSPSTDHPATYSNKVVSFRRNNAQ